MLLRLFRFHNPIRRLFPNFFSILICLAFFSGCQQRTNLSLKEPYIQAVGKQFVLQRDYYVFKIREIETPYIGQYFWLPKEVNEKYVGSKNGDASILGIAKKGTILKIEKFIEEYVSFAGTFDYLYISIDGRSDLGNINADSLTNSLNNPPTAQTWSDPPIFDPKAALPLPSDGVWWK